MSQSRAAAQSLESTRPARLLTGGVAALLLTLGLTACGSDAGTPGSGGSEQGTTAPTSSSADAGSSTAPASEAPASDTASGAQTTACTKDSDYLSGSSTIVWTPDAKSAHRTTEAAADKKYALTADGALEPKEITVKAGEVFTVTLAADAKGISVLQIGCDGGQTMVKDVPAGVYITTPGTYAVTSGITADPAGSIVVE